LREQNFLADLRRDFEIVAERMDLEVPEVLYFVSRSLRRVRVINYADCPCVPNPRCGAGACAILISPNALPFLTPQTSNDLVISSMVGQSSQDRKYDFYLCCLLVTGPYVYFSSSADASQQSIEKPQGRSLMFCALATHHGCRLRLLLYSAFIWTAIIPYTVTHHF